MANERALGLSFIYAAQTRAQLTSLFGEHESRALLGLTNVLVMFGGSKDVAFNQEISDLLGTVRVGRVTHNPAAVAAAQLLRRRHRDHAPRRGAPAARTPGPGDRRERQTHHRQAHRCVEGTEGDRLLAQQRALEAAAHRATAQGITPEARAAAALAEARRLGFKHTTTTRQEPVS